MNNYVVLLRGVNVGGHNKLPMAYLRTILTQNGYANVSTYIQSGNILLTSDKELQYISMHIKELINKEFGYNIPVLTLSVSELKSCVKNNPFLNSVEDIKFLHITFLDNVPETTTLDALNINTYNNDEFKIKGRFVYLHTPDGFSKTKFSNTQFEKQLSTTATTRNWRTVTKLVALNIRM